MNAKSCPAALRSMSFSSAANGPAKDHPSTSIQTQMLKILELKGPMEPKQLLMETGSNMWLKDLEREFTTLRHMEKVRGEKQGDKVPWRIW